MERDQQRVESMPEVPGMKARDYRIFVQQAECSMEAKSLWYLIDSYADGDGKGAFPSVQTLCEQSGKKKKWVEKYLNELERTGHLKRFKRPPVVKNKFPGNGYILFARSQIRPTRVPPIRTHYHTHYNGSDTLSVESEAILRVVPRTEDAPAKYG